MELYLEWPGFHEIRLTAAQKLSCNTIIFFEEITTFSQFSFLNDVIRTNAVHVDCEMTYIDIIIHSSTK